MQTDLACQTYGRRSNMSVLGIFAAITSPVALLPLFGVLEGVWPPRFAPVYEPWPTWSQTHLLSLYLVLSGLSLGAAGRALALPRKFSNVVALCIAALLLIRDTLVVAWLAGPDASAFWAAPFALCTLLWTTPIAALFATEGTPWEPTVYTRRVRWDWGFIILWLSLTIAIVGSNVLDGFVYAQVGDLGPSLLVFIGLLMASLLFLYVSLRVCRPLLWAVVVPRRRVSVFPPPC